MHIIDDVTAAELSKNLNRKIKRKEEERKKKRFLLVSIEI